MIEAELQSSAQWVLSDEGKLVAEGGSHEAQVYNAIPSEGSISQAEIMVRLGFFSGKTFIKFFKNSFRLKFH